MRSYGIIKPSFWNGETGRAIKAGGPADQLLACYLLTNPHANMIGLYYLPVVLMRQEMALTPVALSAALERLSALGFCRYDAEAEMVWVCEMARFQLGEELKASDHRVKSVARMYADAPGCCFLGAFFDRYGAAYGLPVRREGASEQGASEAPSKGLHIGATSSPVHPVPVPVLALEKEKALSAAFERFWSAYPRKVKKPAAFAAWRKLAPDAALVDRMLAVVDAQRRTPGWLEADGQFIPHPASWLNGRRWEDELPVAPPPAPRPVNPYAELHAQLARGRTQDEIDAEVLSTDIPPMCLGMKDSPARDQMIAHHRQRQAEARARQAAKAEVA